MGMQAKISQPQPQLRATGPVSKTADPKSALAAEKARMEILLTLEAEVRKCKSLKQLQFLIANETGKLISARQTVLLHGSKNPAIITISSLASVDRTSPTLRWLESALKLRRAPARGEDASQETETTTFLNEIDGSSAPGANWPFCHTMYTSLDLEKYSGNANIAFLSERKFTTSDMAMVDRLRETYAHAWNALAKSRISFAGLFSRKIALTMAIVLVASMFAPVTMTVLAPVEIVARNPLIVAAPLTGVIGSISVNPNTKVKKGELLFSYTPTDLANELEIADQAVEVARSRYRRASQDAFGKGNGRREMAVLKSELNLASAKLIYAQSRLELSRVRAPGDGVILFSDKDEWIGRPVSTGEKIMRIADPGQKEFRIKLAVNDSIILEDGNEASIFLDADPLNPVTANIVRRSFHAKADEMNNLTYELIAQSQTETGSAADTNNTTITQRIGVRGTAQLFGKKVPLALFLFRRPLSTARQFLGW